VENRSTHLDFDSLWKLSSYLVLTSLPRESRWLPRLTATILPHEHSI